jgi:hypothetical protein
MRRMLKHPKRWRLWNSDRPLAYRLYRGKEYLVTAQQATDGSWFWYGLGNNTAGMPVKTFDEVKGQVAVFLNTEVGRAMLEPPEAT